MEETSAEFLESACVESCLTSLDFGKRPAAMAKIRRRLLREMAGRVHDRCRRRNHDPDHGLWLNPAGSCMTERCPPTPGRRSDGTRANLEPVSSSSSRRAASVSVSPVSMTPPSSSQQSSRFGCHGSGMCSRSTRSSESSTTRRTAVRSRTGSLSSTRSLMEDSKAGRLSEAKARRRPPRCSSKRLAPRD